MLPGPNVAIMGPVGRGKTSSLRTLPHAGLQTFVLFTEPHQDKIADLHGWMHWHHVQAHLEGWDAHIARARTIQHTSWDTLVKQVDDPQRARYDAWIQVYPALANFTCDACGQEFGDVMTWGPDRALAIDGMSGLNQMSLDFCRGGAVADDYGRKRDAAADQVYNLFGQTLPNALQCTYVFIAHTRDLFVSEEKRVKTTFDILGKRTAGMWGRNFQDIVLAHRQGNQFWWSNDDEAADTKNTYLPLSPGLAQDFGPLIEAWRRRAGLADGGVA